MSSSKLEEREAYIYSEEIAYSKFICLWAGHLTLASDRPKEGYLLCRLWRTPGPELQGQRWKSSVCEWTPNPEAHHKLSLYPSLFLACVCQGSLILYISRQDNSLECPEWTMWKAKLCLPLPVGDAPPYGAVSVSISLLQGNKVSCSMSASSGNSFKTHLPKTLWKPSFTIPSQSWRI